MVSNDARKDSAGLCAAADRDGEYELKWIILKQTLALTSVPILALCEKSSIAHNVWERP